jgi:hypothetical protein
MLNLKSVVAEINHHWRRPEPVGLIADVEDTDRKPNAAYGLGQRIQIPPKVAADQETN